MDHPAVTACNRSTNHFCEACSSCDDHNDIHFVESRYPLFIVAPEGTTKHKHCLLTFAKGAFAPGLPVMPVLLKYSSVRFNPGWGIVYTAWHFFRMFNQFKNNVVVEVLPIYYPSPGMSTSAPIRMHDLFLSWEDWAGVALH